MAEGAVPKKVLDTVAQLDGAVNTLEEQVRLLLSACTRESISLLAPLDRASTFLCLSKAVNALFCIHLRTKGESPNQHAKSELERVSLYHDKVQLAVDRSKAPSKPTSSINVQAANRFIEHAIPDLSEEQRRQVREIGRGKGRNQNRRKRSDNATVSNNESQQRKKPSVAEQAAAFLAEASKELLASHAKPTD